MKDGLRESLKKHVKLIEYDHYAPEDMDLNADKEVQRILGEEDPEGAVDDEENTEDPEAQGDEEATGEEGGGGDELGDLEDLDGEEGGEGEELTGMGSEESQPEEEEDVEELDVTELVQQAEEAQEAAEQGNQKIEQLFSKFEELEGKLNYMDKITQKIENLESEIEKRNPTPEEEMEMRSFDSYPYNLKLTDYWSEKTGYEATEDDEDIYDEENDEYVLRASDVENEYSEQEVKRELERDNDNSGGFPLNL